MKKLSVGFSLLELLVSIAIIAVLAALVVQVAGYAQRKGATARAGAEIAAMLTALESYKADQGIYPGSHPDGNAAKTLDPSTDFDPSPPPSGEQKYKKACGLLAVFLSGPAVSSDAELQNFKVYFEPNQSLLSKDKILVEILGPSGEPVLVETQYYVDPFGYSYGYSTRGVKNGSNFPDLWSTSGNRDGSEKSLNQWIVNW